MEHTAEKKGIKLDSSRLDAATLLHDIDKNVPKLQGEQHPDACIRIVRAHSYDELVDLIRSHPLHSVLDSTICPKTVEEIILYVADKITKYEPIGLEARFALWRREPMVPKERDILSRSYLPARQLAHSLWKRLGVSEKDVLEESRMEYSSIRKFGTPCYTGLKK